DTRVYNRALTPREVKALLGYRQPVETGSDSATVLWTPPTPRFTMIDEGRRIAPTFYDFDDDGDEDIIIGLLNGQMEAVENIGMPSNPHWSEPTPRFAGVQVSGAASPAFCDLNGDGDKEMIVGDRDGRITVYENYTVKGPVAPPTADGLFTHFSMDYNTNAIIFDESPNGFLADVTGPIPVSNGVVNGAYQFDGVNDIIERRTSNGDDHTNFSLSVWTKLLRDYVQEPAYFATTLVVGQGGGFAASYSGARLTLNITTNVVGALAAGRTFASEVLTPGEWYHVSFTYDGFVKQTYLDGVLVHSTNVVRTMAPSDSPLTIGDLPRSNPRALANFHGYLDEFRLYNRALTHDEIKTLYNQGARSWAAADTNT
ncbi:MAG: LamG domain-containing protein, partial [Verrucomicrobiota bacterium]